MEIAEGLHMLKLSPKMMGASGELWPVLIWDNDSIILVDTGLPGQLDSIKKEMVKAGVPFEKLDKVILTHQDMDHIGSLSAIIKKSDNKIEIMSHEKEKPYIEGEKRPIKMTPERIAQIEKQLESLSREKREKVKDMYANTSAPVDTVLEDGQLINKCGGITVIHTPGHTPGHICLYLNQNKTLITGDALNVIDEELQGPNPQFTHNMDEAVSSLKKLEKFDIEKVICYHGGLYSENANQRIAELANSK